MSDADPESKFAALAAGILPANRIRQLMDLCWNVEELSDIAAIGGAAS